MLIGPMIDFRTAAHFPCIIHPARAVDQFQWPSTLRAVRVIEVRTEYGKFTIRNPAKRDIQPLLEVFRHV
ncbi:hypothetical protein EAO68_02470 [Streptomyces sp. wa22]|nr:hypothetical protein EAO68_02470 [Streptomyces sp. wa22]